MAFVTLVMEHNWNEKQLNGSTMKDQSDDSSHHKQTFLPLSYITRLQEGQNSMLMGKKNIVEKIMNAYKL